MTEEFFFCQKSYGNTTRFNFFFHTKKKSVTGLGIFGLSDQKIFQYDERSHDMIRSDRKILIFVKSLMGTKLESIFFIRAKFTKFDLALKKVMKNRSKLLKELSELFLII